jgi:Tfp pilus assembly protein PilF
MLLERGMTQEALAAFEATLKKEPHRLGATLGAAKAAERAGELGKARQYYAAVVALTANADPIRDDVAAARASMTRSN